MIKDLKQIELKDGDILHCMSNGWLARLIQFFTKSKFNHSALVISIYGNIFIADSQIKGTYPKTLKEWQDKYNYKYIISRPNKFTKKEKERAIEVFGKTSYDFASLLYQAWFQITGRWKGKTQEKAEDRMYCSEYVSYVFDKPNWWKASPVDLFEYTVENDNFTIVEL